MFSDSVTCKNEKVDNDTNNCAFCVKKLRKKCKSLFCEHCERNIHFKCNFPNEKSVENTSNIVNKTDFCNSCFKNIFPFSSLSDNDFFVSVTRGLNVDSVVELNFPSPDRNDLFQKLNNFVNSNISENLFDTDEDDSEKPVIHCN